jgi:hypothetical protein
MVELRLVVRLKSFCGFLEIMSTAVPRNAVDMSKRDDIVKIEIGCDRWFS